VKKRKESRAAALRRTVEERAGRRCEYCRSPQRVSGYRFHLDHVIPRTAGGSHVPSNRALACAPCNLAKVDRRIGVDPPSGDEVPLFNPRKDIWEDHFHWADEGENLIGRTAAGRATIAALDMNNEMRMEARRLWFATGWLP
jgi:5-methylcytosine-specific restriction endonuclease McrA